MPAIRATTKEKKEKFIRDYSDKRDYIARPENHFKRSLVFSTLTVRL